MKHPVNESSGGVSPRFVRAAAAGLAALMLAALVQPAAAAQLQAPDIEVDEGEKAVFKITLPQAYNFTLRYPYKTQDGTAKSGRHYDAKQGKLVFWAGTTSLQVEVQTRVSQDAVTRNFKLVISEGEHYSNQGPAGWVWINSSHVPGHRTIHAKIRDAYVGATGPE